MRRRRRELTFPSHLHFTVVETKDDLFIFFVCRTKWFTRSFFRADWFFIVSDLNGMVLAIDRGERGGSLVLAKKEISDRTLWRFSGDGKILSKSGLVGDVMGGVGTAGTPVIAWTSKLNGCNQKWRYENGIIESGFKDLVLDIEGGRAVEGQPAIVWWKHGRPWQKWRLEYPADHDRTNWFFLENAEANRVLQAHYEGLKGRLRSERKHGGLSQLWQLDHQGRLKNGEGFVVDVKLGSESELRIPFLTTKTRGNVTWRYEGDGISPTWSDSYFYSEDNGNVILDTKRRQTWSLTKLLSKESELHIGKWFAIENEESGLVLSIMATTTTEPNVVVAPFDGDEDQIWRVDELGRFLSKSGLVLDVKRERWEEKTEIIGFPPKEDASMNQKWRFEHGLIISLFNGLAIAIDCDVNDGDDAKILTSRRNGYPSQKWTINERLVKDLEDSNLSDDTLSEQSDDFVMIYDEESDFEYIQQPMDNHEIP